MSDWKLPWTGACMCGRVTLRISAAPIISSACHCRGCQKLTGGAYSLTMMIPAEGFASEGETEIGALHLAESQHHFCAHCKNWVFSKGMMGGQFVNIRPTMLDDARWVRPYIECYAPEKLPGVVTGASRSFDAFPPPEAYGELMKAYAREGERP